MIHMLTYQRIALSFYLAIDGVFLLIGVVGGRKEIFEPSRAGTGLYLIKSERIHLFANLCSCRPGGGRLGSLSTRRINILQLSLSPLGNNQKEYRYCILSEESINILQPLPPFYIGTRLHI